MKKLTLDKERRAELVGGLQRYFVEELDFSIGAMPAERLAEFVAEFVGPYYYNQGLADAQSVFAKALDDVNDSLYGLERRATRAR
jgi:uncharacterized protein (DUF2164 family)